MVYVCCVPACKYTNKEQKMHSLPKDEQRFTKWVESIGRPDLLKIECRKRRSYRLCDVHFDQDAKFETFHNRTNLKADAVPTLFLNSTHKFINTNCEINSDVENNASDLNQNVDNYVDDALFNKYSNLLLALPVNPGCDTIKNSINFVESSSNSTEYERLSDVNNSSGNYILEQSNVSTDDSTKMEAKCFGVKKSLLKELQLFQSALKKKRKMFFDVELRGNVGSRQTRIMTEEGKVVIDGFYPFYVRREDYSDQGPTQISLVYNGIIEFKIKFDSTEYKEAFLREISSEWILSPQKDE